MEIYGHEIDLEETEPDEIITDVMVLARTVSYDDDGHGQDSILVSTTRQTTGMIQSGMLHFAMETTAGYEVD